MEKYINLYGQELHVGDYIFDMSGYGLSKIETIVSPDKAQSYADGSFRIWFWCGTMDGEGSNAKKHIRGTKGNDNHLIYKVEPNEEIEKLFSLKPTDEDLENRTHLYEEFFKIKNKYWDIYERKIPEEYRKINKQL